MLDAASLGSINGYEEGIIPLSTIFREWGCLSRADTTMRMTQWQVVLSELKEGKAPYDPKKPWDAVIKHSSFAQDAGLRTHWWWLNLVGPLSMGGGAERAMQTIDALENRPSSSWMGAARGYGGKVGAGKGEGKDVTGRA